MESRQKRCKNCLQFYENPDQTCRYHPGVFKTGHTFSEPVWSCCVARDTYKPSGYKFSRLSDQHHGCRMSRQHVEDQSYTARVDNFALVNCVQGGAAYGAVGSLETPGNEKGLAQSPFPSPIPNPAKSALAPHIEDIPYFPSAPKLHPLNASTCALCFRHLSPFTRRHNCHWCGVVVCCHCSELRRIPIIGVNTAQVCRACIPTVEYEFFLVQTNRWTSTDRPSTGNYWAWLDYVQTFGLPAFAPVCEAGRADSHLDNVYRSPFVDVNSPLYHKPQPQLQPTAAEPSPAPRPSSPPDKPNASYSGPEPVLLPPHLLPEEVSEPESQQPAAPAGPELIRASEAEGVELKDGLALVPHQVRPDQTLVGLSFKYGVDAKHIQRVNRMTDDRIITRKVLLIPLQPDQQIDWNFCLAPVERRIQVLALKRRIQDSPRPRAGPLPVTYEEADFYLREAKEDSELAFRKWQDDRNWSEDQAA